VNQSHQPAWLSVLGQSTVTDVGSVYHDKIPDRADTRWRNDQGIGSLRRVTVVSSDELIAHAEAVLNPITSEDRLFGNVGCALLTAAGNLHSGECIDTGSGTGFCAEHAAIAACSTRKYDSVRWPAILAPVRQRSDIRW
jgi:hypothetical protein